MSVFSIIIAPTIQQSSVLGVAAQQTSIHWFKPALRAGAKAPVPTRTGGAVEHNSESVQETFELYNGASSSTMFAVKGRCDFATGKGGREEARGGRTGGERG